MKKEKTVYLLGAGFSKPAGAPLGDELLSSILDFHEIKVSFEKYWRLSLLDSLLSHWFGYVRNWNFEQILTILQSRQLFEIVVGDKLKKPPFNKKSEDVSDDLIWAAMFILNKSIHLNQKVRKDYESFVDSLDSDDSIITLNYDLILENIFPKMDRLFSVCLPGTYLQTTMSMYKPESPSIKNRPITPILKIHGSCNYVGCKTCGYTKVTSKKIVARMLLPFDKQVDTQPICPKCNKQKLRPAIVPPNYLKVSSLDQVRALWPRAADELRKADRLVVIGCSLSPMDVDLDILLRATISRKANIPIDFVCTKYDPVLASRCRSIFPWSRIRFYEGGFEQWAEDCGLEAECEREYKYELALKKDKLRRKKSKLPNSN